jgi:hypothetical protein
MGLYTGNGTNQQDQRVWGQRVPRMTKTKGQTKVTNTVSKGRMLEAVQRPGKYPIDVQSAGNALKVMNLEHPEGKLSTVRKNSEMHPQHLRGDAPGNQCRSSGEAEGENVNIREPRGRRRPS